MLLRLALLACVALPVHAFAIEGLGNDDQPVYVKPVGATKVRYIEALEDNANVIYPALALLVIALVALGILQALRSDDMDAEQKAEVKRKVLRELRLDLGGMTVEQLSKRVALPSHRLFKILEEMQEAGMVEHRTDTRRVTTWHVKGLEQ